MANILPLILGAGAVAVLMGGKKKPKKKSCPEGVTIRFQDIPHTTVNLEEEGGGMLEISAPTAALNAAAAGERDIIKLAKIVATQHIPERCLADPAVRVVITGGHEGEEISMSAPEVFFLLAGGMVSDVGLIMKWSEDDRRRAAAAVITWWNQNMPNMPFPQG